jgi:hypothetical protein
MTSTGHCDWFADQLRTGSDAPNVGIYATQQVSAAAPSVNAPSLCGPIALRMVVSVSTVRPRAATFGPRSFGTNPRRVRIRSYH